jgi:hypothetical protein
MSDTYLQAVSARANDKPADEELLELQRGTWATDRVGCVLAFAAFLPGLYASADRRAIRRRYDATRMYYRWTFMPAGKERSRSLALIASRGMRDYSDRDLYTFGVYTGESLKFWLERLAALGVTHGPMWGFDSFEGLPAEAEGKELESRAWLPGAFSAADQFDAKTFGEVKRRIFEHLGHRGAAQTQLIRGFFSDSLTPDLAAARGMKPALLVDVDVDLYISAVQCLDWMFTHRLIVPGTVVYYDDVKEVKAEAGGELAAHEEMTAKYQVARRP